MIIDGTTIRRASGWNKKDLERGSVHDRRKLNCDRVTVTCDYFSGDIDCVTITAA